MTLPAWPSGRYLLEWEDFAAAGAMRLINVSNGHSGPTIDSSDSIMSADVSSNGQRLVCCVQDLNTGDLELKTVAMDGSNQTVLLSGTYSDEYQATSAAWSPDGTRIAFDLFDNNTYADTIAIMNADGSDEATYGSGRVTRWR